MKKIENVINDGWTVCIWNDKRVSGLKDINDMVSNGIPAEEIVSIINECSYSELSAKAKFMEYKKV